MAANTQTIFPLIPYLGVPGVLLSTAMTAAKAYDGTEAVGTSMALIGTAGADGMRVDTVRVKFASTAGAAPSGTFSANVLRVWVNNGSVNTIATNNILIGELAIPSTSITNAISQNVPLPELALIIAEAIPATYRLYAGLVNAAGATNGAFGIRLSAGQYS